MSDDAARWTPEQQEILRKLKILLDTGIVGLQKSRWRPGMPPGELVTSILFEAAARLGKGRLLAELQAAADSRCRSCDHLPESHQEDGCRYTVAQGKSGRSRGCPCSVPRATIGSS
ncbi:hypothetical protein ACFHW2_37310 [Actinomadura sp. LOL_016]|uniref:hypothetical protein n=1 Tax=unclassified Actinomadura TaxID=2626254 RepID=UPI003A80A87A